MRLLLAGGGTGGHLFPAIAVAEQLMAEDDKSEVLFVGTARGIEARVLPKMGLPLELVDIRGFSGRSIPAKFGVMMKLVKSVMQGMNILKSFAPDVVLGVGGYASAPMVLAASLKGVPVVLQEQNAIAGMTNRLLGRWAKKVCVAFDETTGEFSNAELTGNPLRKGFEECPDELPSEPTLLVFGGSRGARAINEAVVAALPAMQQLNGKLNIIHQTGDEDLETVQDGYRKAGWQKAEIVPFIDDMAGAYRQAHLVVCRAGATTVAELTACGRPAILIPYPHAANDHQAANARALAVKGAAMMLDQAELTGERLAAVTGRLLENGTELVRMGRIARSLGQKGAAGRVVEICRQVSGRKEAA